MYKRYLGLVSVLLILTIGCKNKRKRYTYDTEVKRVLEIKKESEIEISDKREISNIEVIKLETEEGVFLGGVDKIIFYDNKIFILDRMQSRSLFCFGMDGKFLFKIHKPGRGPGEYRIPEEFIIQNDVISIFDNGKPKKINYDLHGNFLNETNAVVRMRNIVYYNKDTCLVRPDEYAVEEPVEYNLLITDKHVKKIYAEYIPNMTLNESIFSVNKAFSVYDDSFLHTYGFNDTIYQYTSGKIVPLLFVDFGEHKITSEIINTTDDQKRDEIFNPEKHFIGFISNLSENKKYISFDYTDFSVRGKRGFVLYDKANETHFNISRLRSEEFECTINTPKLVHNERFVSILTHRNFDGDSSFISDEDNPALVFYDIDMSPNL